ncbi:MAG: hypothetical protein RJS97_08460 [Parvibaculaceae bacterium]
MIVKRHIEKDLKRLQALYTDSIAGPDADIPIYFSKLAVLELAGWIEDAFDLIAARAVKHRVKSTKFDKLAKSTIKRNHGFAYDGNFLTMMAGLIGLPECEQLEQYLDSDGSLSILTSELDAIVNQRRVAAHVALAHTTVGFDSPSVSLGRLAKIHPIARDIYSWFC